MRISLLLGVAAIATTLAAAPLAAQDLTGTWAISSQTRRGTQTMTLELSQSGADLSGTVTLTMGGGRRGGGGGGGGAQTIEITDGSVDGDGFSFTMTLSFNGNSMSQDFSGTFEDDAMEGMIEGGRGGGREFTGTRGG